MQKVFSKEFLVRALRIVLVFALVFWSSFRVECLAFASIFLDTPSSHEGQVLSNVVVWQVTDLERDDESVLERQVRDALDTAVGKEQAETVRVSAAGGHVQFVALPYWKNAEVTTYTVAYSDGFGKELYSASVAAGNPTPTIEDPTREGYVFTGWDPAVAETVEGDVEYVAQWELQPSGDEPGEGEDPGEGGESGEGGDGFEDISGSSASVSTQAEAGSEAEEAEEARESNTANEASEASAQAAARVSTQALETQANDLTIADFMVWEVSEESSSVAKITCEEGVATLEGKAPGLATVRCYPSSDFDEDMLDPAYGGSLVVEFTVQVVGVSSIELYRADSDDEVRVDGDTVELGDDERTDFGFWARANVSYDDSGSGAVSFKSTADKPLSKSSKGLLGDLSWSVTDEQGDEVPSDVASITADGVLTVADNTTVRVRCSTDEGFGGVAYSEVTVKTGAAQKEPVDQGDDNPQDPLTIIVKRPGAAAQDDEGNTDDQGQESGEAQGEDGDQSTEAEGSDESEGSEESEGAKDAEDSEGDSSAEGTEETFTLSADDFDTIESGIAEKTYTMFVDGEYQMVTGRGPSLQAVLDKIGLPMEEQENIDTLEFVNGYDTHVTVAWADLVALTQGTRSYILVARDSYVHEPGDFADDSQEGESVQESEDASDKSEAAAVSDESAEKPTFFTNTRFRILLDQTANTLDLNAGNLRWVNTIIVNMKGKEPEPDDEPEPDPELGVSIDYIPAPEGADAFLSAVPNQSIGGANFGFTWERSTDKGETWSALDSDTVQTLRVRTDEDHIGNLYRVTLNTSMKNKEGEDRWARSEPVEIVVGKGISLALYYVPPLAGDWANFTSQLRKIDPSSPNGYTELVAEKYIWESSIDGGVTWTTTGLESENDRTLKVKTNPVTPSADEGDSDGSSDSITLTYIRVRAFYEGTMYTSNTQLLTVRVGDDDGDDSQDSQGDQKSSDIEDAINDDANKQNPQKDDFSDVDDQDDQSGKKEKKNPEANADAKKKKKKVTPIESVEYEDYYDSSDAATDDGGYSDVPTLIVNEQFDELLKQQEQQKNQQNNAVPGARWSELSVVKNDDVSRVLAGNPFAPLTAPFALGMTAAGVVEKLVAFRRQTR